jgi:hypothetical protein
MLIAHGRFLIDVGFLLYSSEAGYQFGLSRAPTGLY